MRVVWKGLVTGVKLVAVTAAAVFAAVMVDGIARDFLDIGTPFSVLTPSFDPPRRTSPFVRSDLRNFVTANEAYYTDHGRYGTYDEVVAAGMFMPTSGITIVSTDGHDRGFSASGTHVNWPGGVCNVFVGTVRPPVAVKRNQQEGEVACTREGEDRRFAVVLGWVWLGAIVASAMVLDGVLRAGTGFLLGLFLGPLGLLAAFALRRRAGREHRA